LPQSLDDFSPAVARAPTLGGGDDQQRGTFEDASDNGALKSAHQLRPKLIAAIRLLWTLRLQHPDLPSLRNLA